MKPFGKLKSHSFAKRILLRRLALLFSLGAFSTVSCAQPVVKGTVTSADTAVSSVLGSVNGTDVTTLTKNGNFSINTGTTSVIAFSLVGHIAQEVPVKSLSTISVLFGQRSTISGLVSRSRLLYR
ncbi:MAG: hypothetical protein ABIY62_00890 [Ginsengibacter sp.]